MMKLNTKTIKFTVKEHDIQSSSFFCFFSSNKKFRILNTTRTFVDFIQNQQKKTQKKSNTTNKDRRKKNE